MNAHTNPRGRDIFSIELIIFCFWFQFTSPFLSLFFVSLQHSCLVLMCFSRRSVWIVWRRNVLQGFGSLWNPGIQQSHSGSRAEGDAAEEIQRLPHQSAQGILEEEEEGKAAQGREVSAAGLVEHSLQMALSYCNWPSTSFAFSLATIWMPGNDCCIIEMQEEEKAKLAEKTGLDQKQINNWFINQRKRHWKPSEDMRFALMDGVSGSGAAAAGGTMLYFDRGTIGPWSKFLAPVLVD